MAILAPVISSRTMMNFSVFDVPTHKQYHILLHVLPQVTLDLTPGMRTWRQSSWSWVITWGSPVFPGAVVLDWGLSEWLEGLMKKDYWVLAQSFWFSRPGVGPEHVCHPRLRVPASQLRTTAQFILSGDDNTFLMLRSWQQSSFQLMESGVTEKYI